MNAAVLVDGLSRGGPEGAKALLRTFWERLSQVSANSVLQPSWVDRLMGGGGIDFSPAWRAMDMLLKQFGPYQINPMKLNPLQDLLGDVVDFERLRSAPAPALFVCATNVLTGRLRVFERKEMSGAAVMASACLPLLFHAVEVDGQHYWDGGYCGNPPIFPLIYMGGSPDVLIVQLNPINIPAVPTDVRGIIDRMNVLSFNSSLMREMRTMKFVTDLIDDGHLPRDKYLRMNIHTIDAEDEICKLAASSKMNADADFLLTMHRLGVRQADEFLRQHFDAIGNRSSTDIAKKFM